MTTLDVASPDAQNAINTALQWFNMKVNSIKPYTVAKVHTVTKEANGHFKIHADLVTECAPGKTFDFELELDPAINNPTALISHKQLSCRE